MTVSESVQERAQRIAELVPGLARQRADNDDPGDWTEAQSYQDFVYTLRSVEARVDETDDGPVVVAWPRMHPHGDYWTNIASEVLDRAAGQVDDEEGDTFTFQYGRIEQGEGSHEARLVLPKRLPCNDCGAQPDEDCRVPNCQGSWV